MRRFFGRFEDDRIIVEGDDFLHLKLVLRLGVDDEIEVSVGDEFFYACKISELKKQFAVCKVLSKVLCEANPKKKIALFMATPKGDKAELVVQKATELGLTNFFLFCSEFAVKKGINTERLLKITKEACKQCGRSVPVELQAASGKEQALSYADMLEKLKNFKQVIFANEKGGVPLKDVLLTSNNIAIIIGAEGGFSDKEIEALQKLSNVTAVTLGRRILRCETAAIALASFVSFNIN